MNRYRALRSFVLAAVAPVLAPFVGVAFAEASRAADDNTTQTRVLAHFDRIRLTGPFDTEIVAGSGGTKITIGGSRDTIRHVTTAVRDDELIVEMPRTDALFAQKATLLITLPVLRGFVNQGAGSIRITGLTGGDVDISDAGAAALTAAGRAARMKISLDGTGKIDTTKVDARDVIADNNGVGSVYVRASDRLTLSVNGVGEIRYAGTAAHVESHVNGIGRIARL